MDSPPPRRKHCGGFFLHNFNLLRLSLKCINITPYSCILGNMKRLFEYLKDYWAVCVVVLILASINQIFSLLDPYIFRFVIDDYALRFSEYTRDEFIRGAGLLLLLAMGAAFISRIAKNFQDYFLNMIAQRIGARLYADGVQYALSLPYQVFEDQRSGETLNILQKVRGDVEKLMISSINIVFVSLVGFLFVTIYASTLFWGIALIYGLTIPIIGGLSYYLSLRIKSTQQKIVQETNTLAGSTTESLRNIELVKSLGLTEQEVVRLNTTTEKILDLELVKLRTIRLISFIQGTCINLLRTCIILFMLILVHEGIISFGEFFSLFVYSFFIFGPLQELGGVVNTYREAHVSLERFEEIMSIEPERHITNTSPLGRLENLEFKNVGFSYDTTQSEDVFSHENTSSHEHTPANALNFISFSIRRGESIAFVGPSGSGKTSIMKLIVGLYNPTAGEIAYNGRSLQDIDIRELREQIGFVTQDTQLFAGTIRDNLLFVRSNATDEECLKVLHQSSLSTLLARADKGLDTMIGEGGVKISGGEKQRLSIARALLRKPALLVFDEATSSLDSITEEEITSTIRSLGTSEEHMSILVAHRLSTVMHVDRLFVLEKGKIVESGSHSDLLEKKGLYSAMWRQQIGERL